MMPTLRVHRMRAGATVPRYESGGAAGMDLAACLDAPITIAHGIAARVPTGLQIALPPGHDTAGRTAPALQHGGVQRHEQRAADTGAEGGERHGAGALAEEPARNNLAERHRVKTGKSRAENEEGDEDLPDFECHAENDGAGGEQHSAGDKDCARTPPVDDASDQDADDARPDMEQHRSDGHGGRRPAEFLDEIGEKDALVEDADAPGHRRNAIAGADHVPAVIDMAEKASHARRGSFRAAKAERRI